MALKRVVVTGLGALTPIGNNIGDFGKDLLMGKVEQLPSHTLIPQNLKQNLHVN